MDDCVVTRACSYGSVWQNQRRRLGVFGSKRYSEGNLLASTDRGGWTDRSGVVTKRREGLPRGMHWTVVRRDPQEKARGTARAPPSARAHHRPIASH